MDEENIHQELYDRNIKNSLRQQNVVFIEDESSKNANASIPQFPEIVLDFKCNKEGHESNQAGVICLNQECISNRVICCKCFFGEHSTHCCMPFTDFYSHMNKYLLNHRATETQQNTENSFQNLLTQRNELFANMQRKLNYYLELFNANTTRQQKMMNQLVPFTSLSAIGESKSLEELSNRIARVTDPSAIDYTPTNSTPHDKIIYDYLEAQFKQFDEECLKMSSQNSQIENLINNECKNLFQKIGQIINEQYDDQKLQDMLKLEEASKSALQLKVSESNESVERSPQRPKLIRRSQGRGSRSRSRSKFRFSRVSRTATQQNQNKKEVELVQDHQKLLSGIQEFQNCEFKAAKQLLTKYLSEMRQSYGEQNELAKSKAYYYLGCTQKKLHELEDSIINLRNSLNKYKKYLGKHVLEVADTHFMLGNVYKKMNNFKEAVEYHRKALAIREGFASQHPDLIVRSNFYLGKVYNKKCEPKQAIIYHQKALEKCPDNCKQLAADTNIWLGIDYFQMQQYTESMQYFNAALKLQQEDKNMNNSMAMGWSYYWIGVIKRNMKDTQQSVDNLLLAENIFKLNNQQNQSVLAPIYDDLAGIYRDQQMYNLALKYYLQLEKIVDKEKMDQIELTQLIYLYNSIQRLAEIYAGCGIAYKELTEYQNAVQYLTFAMKLFEKHGKTVGIRKRFHKRFDRDQKELMNKCLLALAEAFYEVGKYKEAQKMLDKAKTFLDEEEYQSQLQKINELAKLIEMRAKQEGK